MIHKQPIIILHGWGLSSKNYSALKRYLREKGHKVITPDLPGFGKKKYLKSAKNLTDYVSFTRKIIKKENIKKPIIIGHSFGGRIAIKLASIYPKIAGKLILTGVPGFRTEGKVKIILFKVLAKSGKKIFSLPPFSLFEKSAKKFLYRFLGVSDYHQAEGKLKDTFSLIIHEDLSVFMKKLTCKTLLVWGEDDKIVPLDIAKKMRKTIRNSKLTVVKNKGHGLPYKSPKHFIYKIEKFLK